MAPAHDAAGPAHDRSRPIFGRADALGAIDRTLDRARLGGGEALLLAGPQGIGKSRVLAAAIARGRELSFRVRVGRSLPEELPPPFGLVGDLLRPVLEEEPLGPEVALPGELPPIFAPLVSEPVLVGAPAPARGATESTPDDLERILAPLGSTAIEGLGAGREEMLTRLTERLVDLGRDGPVLLAIDDLGWADLSSLEVVRRLASGLSGHPIALLATVGAPAEVPEDRRGAVEAFRSHPAVRTVSLGPLSIAEVTGFVRWILGGRAADPADVLRWHAQTEGNPFFIEQLVRAVTGSGVRPPGTAASANNVTEILLSRFRALSDSDRRLLTYAAVLGKEFGFSSLAAVAGLDEERVTESLDRLVQRGLVREKGGEVYEFVTEAVRANVYSPLTETRRHILHRKAGRALAMKGDVDEAELARQFYLGRDDARAVEYNLQAAQRATRAFAFETGVAHLARALESERRRPDRDPRLEIRLLTEMGRLLDELGDLPASEHRLAEAVELARRRPEFDLELGRALLGLAQTKTDRSDYGAAEDLANEAMGVLARVGTSRDLFAAHRVLGVVFWRRGELAPAEAHQRAALEIAEAEGTALEQGHALVDVANTMVPLGAARFEPALALYARAAELFGTVEDHAARARVLMNRAVLEYGAGRPEEALRDLAIALEAAERSRSPIWIGYCCLNLAQWEAELGHVDRALPALERAARVLSPIGDHLGDQQLAMTRGMVAEGRDRLDEAETDFQEALARAREMHLGPEVSEMLYRLAALALRRGDLGEARDRLTDAEKSGLHDLRPDFSARARELAAAIAAAGREPP